MSGNLLRAINAARRGDVDTHAPVQAHVVIDVDAPARLVLDVLADLDAWPRFVPGVSRMQMRTPGPLAGGSRFVWRNKGFRLTSQIQRLLPWREVTWTGRALWLVAVHRNTVEELSQGRCRFRSQESMSGWGVARLMPSKALEGQLQDFVEAVAREAMRRAG